MAGVPWYFDEITKDFKVRPGFRFALLTKPEPEAGTVEQANVLYQARQVLHRAEGIVAQLRELCERLESYACAHFVDTTTWATRLWRSYESR